MMTKLPLIIAATLLLSGCTSLTKGVVQALLDSNDGSNGTDTRQCSIRGPAFDGLAPYLDRQQHDGATAGRRPALKVLMVHGIGKHLPGHATRLAENLSRALALDVLDAETKNLQLSVPLFPDQPLGTLRVSRFADRAERRELLFYELTWSQITDTEKAMIAYDNSGEYSSRRAAINNQLKLFFNDHISDPLIYLGATREKIQLAVTQSMCWMMSRDWDELPPQSKRFCDARQPSFLTELDDDYAFITHSLGSRIVTDSMELLAYIVEEELKERPKSRLLLAAEVMQNRSFPIYMLANQLPLLQLGRDRPLNAGRQADYCSSTGKRYRERIFAELNLIAFSDPNDILSYAVPQSFINKFMDARLCPNLVNITLNIAGEIDLFGLGRVANPLDAHKSYDDDERVIALIANGIGRNRPSPLIDERCAWLETRPLRQ